MTKENGRTTLLVEEEELIEAGNQLLDSMRKVALAGLGVVSYGQEKLSGWQQKSGEWFDELVERGQTVEEDGRHWLDEMKQARRQAPEATDKIERKFDRRMQQFAEWMNLPQRDDIDDITTRLDRLSRKLDELKKLQTA